VRKTGKRMFRKITRASAGVGGALYLETGARRNGILGEEDALALYHLPGERPERHDLQSVRTAAQGESFPPTRSSNVCARQAGRLPELELLDREN
jgi:hypothetical protein